MKSHLLLLLISISLLTSCEHFEKWQEERKRKKSYEEQEKIEDAIVKADTFYTGDIFLGFSIGMSERQFWDTLQLRISEGKVTEVEDGYVYSLTSEHGIYPMLIYPEFINGMLENLKLDHRVTETYGSNVIAALNIARAFMPKYMTAQGSIFRNSLIDTHEQVYYKGSLVVHIYETLYGARVEFYDHLREHRKKAHEDASNENLRKSQFNDL